MVITAFFYFDVFTMFGHNSSIETYAIVFRRQKPPRNDHKIHVSKHVPSKSKKFQMGPRTILVLLFHSDQVMSEALHWFVLALYQYFCLFCFCGYKWL